MMEQRIRRVFAPKPGLLRPFDITTCHTAWPAIITYLAIIGLSLLMWFGVIKMVVAVIAPVRP